MKDRQYLIETDRLYKPSEVANKGEQNPKGLGLLDMHYTTLLRKIENREIPFRDDGVTKGGYRRVYFSGKMLNEYYIFGLKYIVKKYKE